MLSNLFVNGCILIAIIFITVEFLEGYKVKQLSKNTKNVISGIGFSISSILLMKYSIFITSTAFLDFRTISQSASAFYGGPISSIITGLISSTFRLIHFGVSLNSVLTFVSMIISSLLCAYISKGKLNKNLKWFLMIFSTNIVHSILFFLVLDDTSDIIKVIFSLIFGSIIVSTIIYYVFKHLELSRKHMEVLQEQACIDFLTGVHNKRNFNSLYEESTNKIKKQQNIFSVLMIDIDFFKKINDTYGHSSGDKVLKDLGHILNMFVKDHGIVGRIGGEEFSILLKGYSKAEAFEFGENLRKYIEKTMFIINFKKQIHITVSIGVASYDGKKPNVENIRDLADEKLYECKRSGRNKVCS